MTEINNLPIAGIVTNQYNLKEGQGLVSNHVDKSSLLQFAKIPQIPSLGNRDLYALTFREETPFMLPQIQGGRIVEIEGTEYTFKVPIAQKFETVLVSVDGIEPGKKIGEVGVPFKITVNNGFLGSHGAQIMPGLHRDYALQVLNVVRKGANNEHWQYEVIFRGNARGSEFIPQDVMTKGRMLYKIGATRSPETGQDWDSWSFKGGMNKEYIARISDYELQVHYQMTTQACRYSNSLILDKEWLVKNANKVVEVLGMTTKAKDIMIDPKVTDVQSYIAAGGTMADFTPANKGGKLGFKFLTTLYDKISMGILHKEASLMQVYHPGGFTGNDGFDSSYIHPGVFHQFNYSGVRHSFDPRFLTRDQMIAAIDSYRDGKEKQTTFGKEVKIVIRTGDGGGYLLNKIFEKDYYANVTGLVMADALKQFTGNYETGLKINTPWFAGIKIAGKYDITWVIDESLNGDMIDKMDNPLINGHRLFSYTMIIEDADYSASNIRIIRSADLGGDMRMNVVPGMATHPFFENSYMGATMHQGSSTKTGFAAYFTYRPETAIVWDPTRMLKFTPINPYTGQIVF